MAPRFCFQQTVFHTLLENGEKEGTSFTLPFPYLQHHEIYKALPQLGNETDQTVPHSKTPMPFILFFILLVSISLTDGTQLIMVNNCKENVWPGILGNGGHPSLKDGGFHLASGEEMVLQVPEGWSGRIWGRQGCCFNQQTGKGFCQTGDCGGLLQCRGIGGTPPTTLVEMTLGTSQSKLHFYDVSLVDGFNLPVSMKPVGVSGGSMACGVAACEVDLNVYCPSSLVVQKNGKVVGCKSACLAAKSDRYCCTGEFANPKSCKPSVFALLFKTICPRAYSYAYDDSEVLRTCVASRYVITFCPPH